MRLRRGTGCSSSSTSQQQHSCRRSSRPLTDGRSTGADAWGDGLVCRGSVGMAAGIAQQFCVVRVAGAGANQPVHYVDGAWRRMPDHCSDPDSGLCWLGLLARASRQGKQLRKAACLHDHRGASALPRLQPAVGAVVLMPNMAISKCRAGVLPTCCQQQAASLLLLRCTACLQAVVIQRSLWGSTSQGHQLQQLPQNVLQRTTMGMHFQHHSVCNAAQAAANCCTHTV